MSPTAEMFLFSSVGKLMTMTRRVCRRSIALGCLLSGSQRRSLGVAIRPRSF